MQVSVDAHSRRQQDHGSVYIARTTVITNPVTIMREGFLTVFVGAILPTVGA
jgi:hypothetical protein